MKAKLFRMKQANQHGTTWDLSQSTIVYIPDFIKILFEYVTNVMVCVYSVGKIHLHLIVKGTF